MRPIERVRWPRKARASSLGRYFNWSMAICTRCAVLAATGTVPLRTRETVIVPTPASRATSLIVGLCCGAAMRSRNFPFLVGGVPADSANLTPPGSPIAIALTEPSHPSSHQRSLIQQLGYQQLQLQILQ